VQVRARVSREKGMGYNIRQAVARLAPEAVEDDRAACGLTTLSFFSTVHAERHVWLDTDLGGSLVIELEDWTYEGTWDNSVAHLKTTDKATPGIIRAWLTGATVDECVRLGGRLVPHLK
jgi:hypothetical protein